MPQKLPGFARFGLNGPDANKHDHQVYENSHGQRNQRGPGNGLFRRLDLLGNGCDQVVTFKGDKGQPHGDNHAACAVGQKRLEACRGLLGNLKYPLQTVGDKYGQDNDLGHGDDIFDAAGNGCPPHIDEDENNAHQSGHHQCRGIMAGKAEDQMRHPRKIALNKFPEVAAESKGVKRACNDVTKPEHPACGKSGRAGERFADECVAASRFGIDRGQLGISKRRQQSYQAVEGKRYQRAGSGFTGGNSCENENAGADHGPDSNHGGVEEAQAAGKCHRRIWSVMCRR